MSKELIKIEAEGKSVEIRVSPINMMFNSLLSGIAWGVGSVLGATVIFALIIFIVGQLNTAPVIGHYISEILDYINRNKLR